MATNIDRATSQSNSLGELAWTGEWYTRALFIRNFELEVARLFRRGIISGTTHLCIGQEITPVAVASFLKREDVVFSNHRCHGAFLSISDDAAALLKELVGEDSGICGGIGGSQHLCLPGRFYSSGILGGLVPVAVGYAKSLRSTKPGSMVVTYFGDGALGEGVVYEAFNLAVLWSAPILFVLEDNAISQSTPKRNHMAGDASARLAAFGINVTNVRACNVFELRSSVEATIAAIRRELRPRAIIVDSVRLCGHSANSNEVRSESELEQLEMYDPLLSLRQIIPDRDKIEEQVNRDIKTIFESLWSKNRHG